jgi:hypothetical protein
MHRTPKRGQALLAVEQVLSYRSGSISSADVARVEFFLSGYFQHKGHADRKIVDNRVKETRDPPTIPCFKALETRQFDGPLLDLLKPSTECPVLGLAGLLHGVFRKESDAQLSFVMKEDHLSNLPLNTSTR